MIRALDTAAVVAWIFAHLILSAAFFAPWIIACPIDFACDCFDWSRRFAKEIRS